MSITLKDGSASHDKRLGRCVQFDERSRAFPVRAVVPKTPRSYTWRCQRVLDQGDEGSCVGHGIAHELIARPVEALSVTQYYARDILYFGAQKIDEWPGGAYPGAKPFYEGTSVLAGCKVAKSLGWMDSYLWSFGLNDLILGVGYNGPAVLGINWYDGMLDIDSKGFIHATGEVAGGHCILCNCVNIPGKYFKLHNSWGPSWGISGECKVSFSDMTKLLKEDGEAAFFVGRHLIK
jgi:hypothetical protein